MTSLKKAAVLISISAVLFAAAPGYVQSKLRVNSGAADSTLKQQYPFLNTDANVIKQSHALDAFFRKLEQLEKGETDRITIVHIGDSHIQADFMSGEIRKRLQSRFGNAGRGLVFPYRVAGTNGPSDYRSTGSEAWKGARCVNPHQIVPYGLSGISLYTESADTWFQVNLLNEPGDTTNIGFDRMTIFRMPGYGEYDLGIGNDLPEGFTRRAMQYKMKRHVVKKGESLGQIASRYHVSVSTLRNWNKLKSNKIRPGQSLIVNKQPVTGPGTDSVNVKDHFVVKGDSGGHIIQIPFSSAQDHFYVRTIKSDTLQKGSLLFGVSLENSASKGVLYHTIGVNGAQYAHYNEAEHFSEHVAALNPDLVIISLGTNESFAFELDQTRFYEEIDSLVTRLSNVCPDAGFLLSTQPDSYRRRKYTNPRNIWIRETIADYSSARFTALWDLNEIMGGFGSMKTWFLNHLAAKDKVHFNATAYRLQGQLLYNSLMSSYELYRSDKQRKD